MKFVNREIIFTFVVIHKYFRKLKALNRVLPIVAIVATITACGARSVNNQANDQKESAQTENSTKTNAINIGKEQFKKQIFDYSTQSDWNYLGDKPALIDFYADWCAPCKRLAPILEELAGEYKGQIYIYKVDTEKERELAGAFGIKSIPSLLFIPKDGSPQMATGALPKEELVKLIEEFLLKKSAE